MPLIDFNNKKNLQIWDGIAGSVEHSEKVTFGHFTLEEGVILPEHSHPHEQWSHIIEGRLQFSINGNDVILEPGMTALVPPYSHHSGKALTKCKVIDCFLPVREDFVELEKKS